MVKKVYNWGILAPGNIARKFTPELQQLDNARVYAVGSRNAERAKKFADEFGVGHYYNNYEDLVADPEVDIIYIASLHALHTEHALLCLNHKKPVLCEKALALNKTEVDKMVKSALENGVFFMEAFFTPHQPSYKEAKRIIESGELGKVKYIQGWFGFNRAPYNNSQRLLNPMLGGGALLDIGLYPVFDMLYFLGEPDQILAKAEFAETGVDESISIRFDYPEGKSASIYASFVAASGAGTDILCEFGTLRLRRSNAIEQWLEVDKPGSEVKRYSWEENACGLKLEAAEAMRCLDENRLQSDIMPHSMSLSLIKTLDIIRHKAEINYPERD
ncbi:MAG: Gfo/Idh/MocA family oxidoreductase [Bacteroidia bacterium]|nr:Gfo/Idh/MocA family oxidoreductase [Bacteroidia bacterium]